jgi:6-phosphogluconolactonase (cycloisomerase 2 family)
MAKVSIVSLAMVLGLSSCSLDYVVGYVYMTTSSTGVIDQYAIDYQSGALSPVGTPVQAGNNPVRLVAAPNGKFVYVVNQGDSTVQEFAVQGDGSLTVEEHLQDDGQYSDGDCSRSARRIPVCHVHVSERLLRNIRRALAASLSSRSTRITVSVPRPT